MTLNGVIALILRYITEFDSLEANYVREVEDRPIMSAEYGLPFFRFRFSLLNL